MNNSLTHKAIEEINFSKLFGYDFWIKSKGWHTIRSNYFLSNEKSHHCNVYKTSHDLCYSNSSLYKWIFRINNWYYSGMELVFLCSKINPPAWAKAARSQKIITHIALLATETSFKHQKFCINFLETLAEFGLRQANSWHGKFSNFLKIWKKLPIH